MTIAEQTFNVKRDANGSIGTVEEWLVAHFGEEAKEIDGVNSWGRTPISGASFTIGTKGLLQVSCGGTAIITLHRGQTVDKRPLFIVIDGDLGEVWDLRNALGTNPLHQSRPMPRLRLVMSA